MQNKLQELTDKLYEEGLSKGKEEGARILEEARQEAGRILDEAREQADLSESYFTDDFTAILFAEDLEKITAFLKENF